jgi:uncharacterized BrkB/YihY/UPF0761 family membrane protein
MKPVIIITIAFVLLIPLSVFAQESPDPSFYRSAEIGETLSNPEIAIIIESLGAILIVFFIILYAIKKTMTKKSLEEKK